MQKCKYSKYLFLSSFSNTIRVLNGLDPDQDCLPRYRQMTKVAASKERVKGKFHI